VSRRFHAVQCLSHPLQRRNGDVHSARHDDVVGATARGSEAIQREEMLIPRCHVGAAQRIRLVENRAAPETIGRAGIKPVTFDERNSSEPGAGGVIKRAARAIRPPAGAQRFVADATLRRADR